VTQSDVFQKGGAVRADPLSALCPGGRPVLDSSSRMHAQERRVRGVTLSVSPQPLTSRSKRSESRSVFWAVSRGTSHLFTC
jgi:hypothetical protein